MAARQVTGFSLIELMVTMAVMALLMMAVAPSVTSWMVNLRIRNAADSLQNGLQIARNEAVRRNQNITFWMVRSPNPAVLGTDCTLTYTGGSWVVSVTTPVGACNSAPSTTTAPMIVDSHPLGDGASTSVAVAALRSDNSTAGTSVVFDGLGRAMDTANIAFINVNSATNPGSYRGLRITVGPAGAIRLCDPAVTAAGDPRIC